MEPAKRLFIRAVEFMRVPMAEIMANFSFRETDYGVENTGCFLMPCPRNAVQRIGRRGRMVNGVVKNCLVPVCKDSKY